MGRGAGWKVEMVRTRCEERRQRATRLLAGLVASASGGVLLLLAAASEVCLPRAKGAPLWCRPVGTDPLDAGLWLLGGVALVAGICLSVRTFRE